MLPAHSVLAGRTDSHTDSCTCIDRLIDLLRLDRARPAEALSPDPEIRRYCAGAPAAAHGFDWTAPIYEAPDSLKDTARMHDPARDTQPAGPEADAGAFRWRRHPALLRATSECCLSDDERRARLAAVRGVLAAREGDLDAAAAWFRDAACEPSIRFQVVPGFWGCTRGGMEAAVVAYEAAGRFRDAAALAATIRTRYRPRAMQARTDAPEPARLGAHRHRDSSAGTGD